MIVGIDGNEANIEKRVGVNQYAYEILKGIAKLQDEWKDKFKFIVYLKEKPLPDLPKETNFFKYKIIPGGGVWIMTKLTPHLWFDPVRPDIFFSPSHYIPPFVCIPRVCSIMDLGYLKFSGQFRKIDFWQLKLWSAISIYISKVVIAISNSTKADIVRHYPFAKGKIYVTPLAFDPDQFNNNVSAEDVRRVKNKYSIVSDYVLYLGTLKPSKNVEGLVEALASLNLKPQISNLKLVIAGKKGWLYDSIFKKVEELGLKDRVTFTDFVPEEDKPALVKGARVFVLPSFWEGFGLDALNAMACGVPVVASKVGSLPEVVGEAGILVDPYNINSIAKGISEVLLADEKKYNDLVQRGLMQARKFSWENTTSKTLKVLEGIGK
jgi:glycosyltransferase involved in cell wall biosynthesis